LVEKGIFLYVPIMSFQLRVHLSQTRRRIAPPYFKPRSFAKRQCERQWLTPPKSGITAAGGAELLRMTEYVLNSKPCTLPTQPTASTQHPTPNTQHPMP